MRWISTRSSDDVRSERRAWTTASLAVYSAAAVLLLSSSSSSSSSSPFADAFSSSPRPCRAALLPSSAKALAFRGVGRTLPEVVRHGRRIAASSSDGDVGGGGEEEEEEEENELDTESSTTGLFIPGFSDKFAPPDPPAPDQPRAAPPAVVVAKKAAVEPPVKKQQEKKKRNVSLPEEVSRSIIELPSMPKLSLPSLPFPPFGGEREKKRAPTPPSRPPPPRTSSEEESLASALGGLVVGSGLGLYADVASDILSDTDLPAIVPPAFLGLALGAGAYLGAGRPDIVGSAVRLLFGGPVLRLRDAIVGGIRRKVDEIRATPGRIVDAVERKIDETVDEILATPGKIKDAAVERIDETVDEIKVRQ